MSAVVVSLCACRTEVLRRTMAHVAVDEILALTPVRAGLHIQRALVDLTTRHAVGRCVHPLAEMTQSGTCRFVSAFASESANIVARRVTTGIFEHRVLDDRIMCTRQRIARLKYELAEGTCRCIVARNTVSTITPHATRSAMIKSMRRRTRSESSMVRGNHVVTSIGRTLTPRQHSQVTFRSSTQRISVVASKCARRAALHRGRAVAQHSVQRRFDVIACHWIARSHNKWW